MRDEFFRKLDADETADFKQWARDNYTAGDFINRGIWHPAVVAECERINARVHPTPGYKEEIAHDFIRQHKNADVDNWAPYNLSSEAAKLGRIFNNLEQGVYGDVTTHPDDGIREVEIGGHQSASGNPVLFGWEPDFPAGDSSDDR
jgi:hypothetical protein